MAYMALAKHKNTKEKTWFLLHEKTVAPYHILYFTLWDISPTM